MSTHTIDAFTLEVIQNHPNADLLDIIPVGGYECAVSKGSLSVGDVVVYFPPDTMVPLDREEFAHLLPHGKVHTREWESSDRSYHRIKVKKFRGRFSQGYITKAPEGTQVGDNLWDHYNCIRYEPQDNLSLRSPFVEKGPPFHVPHYDLENLQSFMGVLHEDEPVIITVKYHGANAGFVFCSKGERMYCKSRRQWKMPPGLPVGEALSPNTPWWECLNQNPWIETWCRENPDHVVFGELFGNGVQKGFHYGITSSSKYGFRVFDVLSPEGSFVDNEQLHHGERFKGLLKVVVLYEGPFDLEKVKALAEAPETLGGDKPIGHVREGVVIKPAQERTEGRLGRVALKWVSNKYLEKD